LGRDPSFLAPPERRVSAPCYLLTAWVSSKKGPYATKKGRGDACSSRTQTATKRNPAQQPRLTDECPGAARSIRGPRQLAECAPCQPLPAFHRQPECTRTDCGPFASSISKCHQVAAWDDLRALKAA